MSTEPPPPTSILVFGFVLVHLDVFGWRVHVTSPANRDSSVSLLVYAEVMVDTGKKNITGTLNLQWIKHASEP